MKCEQSFFENKTTLELAQELLGKVFTYESPEGIIKGIINETEAYTEKDESCHAYNGIRTKRNEVMFWRAGHLYIYFTYGMYFCANIVTGMQNKGEAVLIRSVIPLEGIEIMKRNRNWTKKDIKGLSNGPAKFCMAYGLNKLHNGEDMLKENSKIYIENLGFKPEQIIKTQRIGISKAKHLEWRFFCDKYKNT